MKNADVGDNQSTRAGRRVRRRDRSRRAPRPVQPSCSSRRAWLGLSERRGAGNPQDADGVSVWRSTPGGGLDAGAQTGASNTGARSRVNLVATVGLKDHPLIRSSGNALLILESDDELEEKAGELLRL